LIYNDGRLPDNWTVDSLIAPHTSKPHNPLIAGAFFRSGQIEAWGRGVEKMKMACREWGKPGPFYRIQSNEVMIGFNTKPQFTDNDVWLTIIRLMSEQPTISQTVIGREINMTKRGVQKNIDMMKKAGLVERIGSAKSGYWKVMCCLPKS
jgi:ATP-dependent DNA helicase RecG